MIETKQPIEKYLYKIRPCLIYLKKSDAWNIQLTLAINFISSKYTNDDGLVHSKGDNIEVMVNDAVDKVITF